VDTHDLGSMKQWRPQRRPRADRAQRAGRDQRRLHGVGVVRALRSRELFEGRAGAATGADLRRVSWHERSWKR